MDRLFFGLFMTIATLAVLTGIVIELEILYAMATGAI